MFLEKTFGHLQTNPLQNLILMNAFTNVASCMHTTRAHTHMYAAAYAIVVNARTICPETCLRPLCTFLTKFDIQVLFKDHLRVSLSAIRHK